MDVDGVVQEVLPEVVAEEVPPFADDVVEEEEPVRLLEEQHLVGRERILGVVGAEEAPEARLEQRVHPVGEARPIAGA